MEGKTPTEKFNYLSNLLATLTEQVKVLDANRKDQVTEHARTAQALADLKNSVVRSEEQLAELQRWKVELGALASLRTDVAIVQRDVEKLEKVKDEWSRRAWAIAGPVLGALVGWLLGYFSRR
jgi:chromosome segregation ATPase